MSLLEVNKITPQSGTTLTLGDTGDTINFGSGVLPNFENLTVTGDLTVDTNSLYVDSTNNRVGIGTTSPSQELHIVSTQPSLLLEDSDNNGQALIDVSGGNINISADPTGAVASSNIDFLVDNSQAVRIDSAGDFMVGTTSEVISDSTGTGTYLDISKGTLQIKASGNVPLVANRVSTDGQIIQFRKDGSTIGAIGNQSVDFHIENASGSGNDTGIALQNNAKINPLYNSSLSNNTIDIGSSSYKFKDGYFGGTVNSADLDVTVGSAGDGLQMTAAGDHYINLGADSNRSGASQSLLQMEGKWNGTAVARMQFVTGTDTTNKDDAEIRFQTASAGTPSTAMTINSSGNVGIGTSNPDYPLTIQKPSGMIRMIDSDNTSVWYAISSFAGSTLSIDADAGGAVAGNIDLKVAGSTKMRIQNNGNVGIGTTSPSYQVHIDGNEGANPQLWLKQNNNGTGILRLTRQDAADGQNGDWKLDHSSQGLFLYHSPQANSISSPSWVDALRIQGANNNYRLLPGQDNVQDLGQSDRRWQDLYMSGNIYLGGTGSANALDDYEEGTWTPTISGSSVTNVGSSSYNKYTKVGDTVYITGYIEFSSTPTENAPINIGGLPFTCNLNASSGNYIAKYFTSIPSAIYIPSPATNFEFYGNTQTGNWRQIKYNDMGGASAFHYSFHYRTNS
jgi:hypothetical protein